MGLLDGLLGWMRTPAPARKSAPASRPPHGSTQFAHSSQFPQSSQQSQQSVRKDLLRMVLRDTLQRNGIPTQWMSADALHATSRGREPGLHLRLVVKHWDTRLMAHAPAIQDNFEKRLHAMDPLAANWLMGVSWMFALPEDTAYGALPHPGAWTAMPPEEPPAKPKLAVPTAEKTVPMAAIPTRAPAPAPAPVIPVPGGDAGIIEGPVNLPDPNADVRADLERLFAVRDADLRHAAEADEPPRSFAATEPSALR
jgi:hypothetical protein